MACDIYLSGFSIMPKGTLENRWLTENVHKFKEVRTMITCVSVCRADVWLV